MNMRLFKRSNGIWYVEVKRGKWRSLKTKDEREAKVRFNALEREILKGRLLILDKTPSVNLFDFLQEYQDWVSSNMADTTYETLTQITPKFRDAVTNKQLSSITTRDMDSFVEYCRNRRNKPATINIAIRTMKASFTKAVEWKYLKESPFRGYSQLKYHKGRPKFIDDPDLIENVFHIIGDNRKYRLIFAFYVYTGARRSEIARLEWEDIKKDEIIFRERKNYEQLSVPIIGRLAEILCRYERGTGKIFNITPEQIGKQIKKYLKKAGIGHLRPHDLRHTFASHLLMNGVDLKTVQELLGHESIQTTQIYAHLTKGHLKEEIKKLPY